MEEAVVKKKRTVQVMSKVIINIIYKILKFNSLQLKWLIFCDYEKHLLGECYYK